MYLCLVHIRSHGDSDLRLCRLNGADICGEVQQRICGTGNCIHILCDDNGTDNDFADPDYHHNNHCIFQNICCNIDNARIVRKSSDRDVNGDGNCTIDDLVMLNQYLLGILHADASQIAAMDCCADGKIDMRDSLILEQFLVYMIDTLPVEP